MIVVDATILMYAVGAPHPLAEPSQRLLAAVTERRIEATTTPEVIQEFAHLYARRRERTEAVRLARQFAELLSPLVMAGPEHLDEALRLFERQRQLGAFDALLAAVAIAHGASALVSADRAFATVPRLRYVDPASINELLG